MPSRETTVTGFTTLVQVAEEARIAAASRGAAVESLEQTDDGGFLVRATFADRDAADEFADKLLGAGFHRTWKHLTRQAVLSWVGHYGYVLASNIGRSGDIERIEGDEDTIHVVPRMKLSGFDLGAAPTPGRTGEVRIEDVQDIVERGPFG